MSGTKANRYAGIAWHRNRLITGVTTATVRNRRKNELSPKPPASGKRHMRAPK